MKITKPRHYQCNAIVQPGEYVISRWDNQECWETNPRLLIQCEECQGTFCIMLHWPKHNHEGEK